MHIGGSKCAGPGRGPCDWLLSSLLLQLLLGGPTDDLYILSPAPVHPQVGFFKRNRPPLEEDEEDE